MLPGRSCKMRSRFDCLSPTLVWIVLAWNMFAAIAMNTSAKGFGPARHFVPASSTEFGLQEEIQTKFRLLSWNVLAPSWDNLGTKQSNWHSRWARILREVRVRKPDVMVLQEVEVLIYDDQIQPFFKARGYLSVYTGVDSGVGVAVFWRSSKFELKSATDFELSTTKLTPWRSLLDGSFNKQQRERYATKSNMVLFVILTCVGQEEVRPHASSSPQTSPDGRAVVRDKCLVGWDARDHQTRTAEIFKFELHFGR